VERALPAVVARLHDEEPEVRQAAVVALLRIGAAAAREELRTATSDPDWQVRVYATEALRRLGRADAMHPR
jgi:HEAT repeat protein